MAQHSASFSRNHQAFLPPTAEWPPSFICCPPGEQPSALPLSDLIVQLRMTCFHLQRPPGSAHLTLAVSLCAGSKAGALVFLLELSGSCLSLLLAVVAAAARPVNLLVVTVKISEWRGWRERWNQNASGGVDMLRNIYRQFPSFAARQTPRLSVSLLQH